MDVQYLVENLPRETAMARVFATKAVLEVEKSMDKSGEEKQKMAEMLAQAYAREFYQKLDAENNYPWLIDEGVEFLIKIFPMLIKEAVNMLNGGLK